jgi:hypothetical protein
MEILICTSEYSKNTNLENFGGETNEDSTLVDFLLKYCSDNDIEIFERRGRVSATDKGFLGAFFEKELTEINPN